MANILIKVRNGSNQRQIYRNFVHGLGYYFFTIALTYSKALAA